MSNYIGVRCPVCNKKFTEADDIVVCPVCGAPHHRSCYAEANQCAFVADHLSGKEWHDPAGQIPPAEQDVSGIKTCARCGTDNQGDSIFCQTCGCPMTRQENQSSQTGAFGEASYQWYGMDGLGTQVNAISMAYGGLKPDDEIEGETVKELAKYVGSGSAYYLPRFRMMSEYGRSFLPNFFAFFFTYSYFFYRKMYAIGFLLLAVSAVSMIPDYLYILEVWMPAFFQQMEELSPGFFQWMGISGAVTVNQAAVEHYTWLASIAQSIRLVIVLIFSFFANRMYYKKAIGAVHAIRSAKTASTTDDEYYASLAHAGGVSKAAVAILLSVMFLLQFILFYVFLYSM